MITVTRRAITLDGIPLHSMLVTRPMGDVSMIYNGTSLAARIRSAPEPWELSFRATIMSENQGQHLYSLARINYGFNLATLGPGFVCQHCGQYNPAGILCCWACGGRVERVPFIKPIQFPASHISFLDRDITYFNPLPREVQVEMSVYDLDPDKHLIPLMESGRFETMQHGMRLDGSWLCEFCGSAIDREDAPCPMCGGYQLPYSELVKIDRDCLYCGSKVENGLVCQGCGAKLAGTTWKMLKGLE